jgi:hypothetical protein
MKAGALLLLFVSINLLCAIWRALKDLGLITLNPTSIEKWFS